VTSSKDRRLLVAAVAVSLGLTGLTVWAMARQNRALREREWTDLRNEARNAAAEKTVRLLADLERSLAAAALAWRLGGVEGVDWWVCDQRQWSLALLCVDGQDCQAFPITPMQVPLPTRGADEETLRYDPDFTDEEARAALARFDELSRSPDPLTRARALLAAADCRRQLGQLQAAGDGYELAAQALRSAGPLARHAFEALVESIACRLSLGQTDRAAATLKSLLAEMSAAHPARYSPAELELLARRARPLLSGTSGANYAAQLKQLTDRAQIRRALPQVTEAVADICQAHVEPDEPGINFRTAHSEDGERLTVAARRVSAEACIALAARAADLIEAYWPGQAAGRWRVELTHAASAPVLCELGPAFGDALLVVSPGTLAQLSVHSRRQTALLLATAAGTAGAWALVIWMMLRAVARQRELLRLQRRFVADVSHELKTPLAMIRLLAETLQDGRVPDPARVREYYGTITREAERLSVLLDNILDFSRIESGRKQYEFGDCDVTAVVRQAWSLFEPQLAAGGFERKLEIEPDLPVIRADPAALQQVLVNLLQNAFRYGAEGRYVRLAVARQGFVILITVEDHGIGMTRAQLERLGDTFFRAEDTRVRQTRGTGLGLAIVNHIVQAHRGKMEVHSRPGQGSRFTIWIPFEPDAAEKTRG